MGVRGLTKRMNLLHTVFHEKELENDKIYFYAYHDYLTGLPNRRKFEEKLDQLMDNCHFNSTEFALLYLDLDHIKLVNEWLGHCIGDELLRQVSTRISSHIKVHDLFARIGGDKFAIVLTELKDRYESIQIADDIMKDFEQPFTIDEYDLNMTASIGIGIFPQDGLTVKDLCSHTDQALHRAKGAGKNCIKPYTPSMNVESQRRFLLVNDLAKAIQEELFFIHYQPKVDPATRKIVGAEALLRWRHPQLGIIPPDEFIPLAEESNLIFELGDWVIFSVCRQIQKWQEEGLEVVPISINISAKRFLKDDLADKLQTILKETKVEPKWLEFEITETSFVHNEGKVLAVIHALKDIGIAISLDDFGTGYSSIHYLRKFKVDFLKIDRTFIKAIHSEKDNEAIVKSILYLARELNIKVVAEGVETEDQLAFLVAHCCDLIQGYLFSKPVEAGTLSNMLTNNLIPA